MILDAINQFNRYNVPNTKAILKFIAENDCKNLTEGEIEIAGRELFVRVMEYSPKPASENKFENHRLHADVQYVVAGSEIMQTTSNILDPSIEYDAKGDYQFFKTPAIINNFQVKAGEFAVFYPLEAHRPACLDATYPGKVKKLVFKVRMNAQN